LPRSQPAPPNKSLAEIIATLPADERSKVVGNISDEEAADLLWRWQFWGRPNQHAPLGAWATWVILAGRGFGKTRAGSEWIRQMVCGDTPLTGGKARRIALIAETAADGRDVMVQGDSGLLAVHPPEFRPIYTPSMRRLVWPNGTIGLIYNATEPDQLRGPQFDAAWADELAKWRYVQETWDNLQFGLRLGSDPRALITTTPRPIQTLKDILAEPGTIVTKGSTYENRSNLAPKFLKKVEAKYAGTRLGRQELDAEILDDSPDALWRRAKLDEMRIGWNEGEWRMSGKPFKLPEMRRIVVAIDPASEPGGEGEAGEGAETGIMVVGLGMDGRGYVIADHSCALDPNGWATEACKAYREHDADVIIAEKNQGGAMVRAVIRSVNPKVPVIEVTASRGKVTRAEPVAALYEQGRISHIGNFPLLEDQMVVFTPFGITGKTTADRTDALVHALTNLFPGIVSFKVKAEGVNKAPPDRWKAAFSRRNQVSDNNWKGE
jgi:phage terminase large subunit-like protein